MMSGGDERSLISLAEFIFDSASSSSVMMNGGDERSLISLAEFIDQPQNHDNRPTASGRNRHSPIDVCKISTQHYIIFFLLPTDRVSKVK